MIAVVIGKLHQRKMLIPAVLPIQTTGSEHVFQSLNGPLRLPISLWMESCTQLNLSAKSCLQPLPNLGSKPRISIRNNGYRDTMQPHHTVYIQPSQLLHGLRQSNRNKMSRFS